jgi:hypothetical protein
VNRGRIPFEYKDSRLHHTEPDQECEVEGCIFYSEGACKWENSAPGKLAADKISERKLQSEGMIRINLAEIIEKTDLSCTEQEDVARKIYIKSVDLTF